MAPGQGGDPGGELSTMSGQTQFPTILKNDLYCLQYFVFDLLTSCFLDYHAEFGHTLFIYNIGPDATEIELYGLFGPFGAITKVHIQVCFD